MTTCEDVTQKVVELLVAAVRPELEAELAKLPADGREATVNQVEERIQSIAARVHEECRSRPWSEAGRSCIVQASTLDDAGRCPVPALE